MHVCHHCSRQLASSPEVATLECKRDRQSFLECRQGNRNKISSQVLTCTGLACYNCWMLQRAKTVLYWQFRVEFILFTQQCIKRHVGFGDKNSVQITWEKISIIGEFEILVDCFLSWCFQRSRIGDRGRAFNETLSSWISPKRVPKMIPLAIEVSFGSFTVTQLEIR